MAGILPAHQDAPRETRIAIAEVLGHELDMDLSPEFLAGVDKFLANLWFSGFKIVPLSEADKRTTP